MQLTACPVRLFTPEVSALFDLFYLTYAVDARGRWQRIALLEPGGILDQPGRDLAALAWLANVWNSLIGERRPRGGDRG